ncbi:NUDIX domain-containing protein [Streptantibioticus silvisoli]|jgi:8-oxo-dGTP pyrophosphatase MutT (NUDIX family)|uniref:NUDIX hydrolase n=1 Tax=Streptantibioticus silvisoli TaxID=2705255 RepID=A0ABT6W7W6_9ACTN|nr:NUDIX hydrolase [Streptantibioticus silvisoli]MDI5966845.1 NUDIX hydrolase [Streptantibioticus silvisoli]
MTWTTMRLPISVKGVVIEEDKVWLRRNERGEWELPGGKLDPGEQPLETVERELFEELGMSVRPVMPVHAYRHTIPGSPDEEDGVLVLSYLCELRAASGEFESRGEGGAARFAKFPCAELQTLNMPAFYSEAIRFAAAASGTLC